jgi:hypothetical protein
VRSGTTASGAAYVASSGFQEDMKTPKDKSEVERKKDNRDEEHQSRGGRRW